MQETTSRVKKPGLSRYRGVLLTTLCGLAFGVCAKGVPAKPDYTIAFTSFAPLNEDLFIADADGSHVQPFLAHPDQDYNASFSRDGKSIVFTSERDESADIYRAHVDGSGLEKLVGGRAFDDQAALSPDGRYLAFVSDRAGHANIWRLDLETKALINLTPDSSGDFRPAWSPDSHWIAFSSDRDSTKPYVGFALQQSTELYVMRGDGTEVQRLTEAHAFCGSPAWSPDGKRLAFYEADLSEVGKTTSVTRMPRGTTQIVSIDLTTHEKQALTSGEGEKWSPHWTSNERINYATRDGIAFITILKGAASTEIVQGVFSNTAWSSDRRHLIFDRDVEVQWPPLRSWHSRDPEFHLVRAGVFPSYSPAEDRLAVNDQIVAILHNSILTMTTGGLERAVLFTDPQKSALAPVWSPKGDQIAFALGSFFQMLPVPRAPADIVVMRADGTDVRTITNGDGNYGFPSWSPDGRRLVYRSFSAAAPGLFIIDLQTRSTKLLSAGPHNFPAWAPVGDRIAFTSNRDGDYEIYTIKPDGTDLKRLTNSKGNDAHLAWSSDGEWIAFSSGRGGFKDETALHVGNAQPYGDIWVMRADGTDVRQLTDDQYEEATPGWMPTRK